MDSSLWQFIVDDSNYGKRLDKVLSENLTDISRAYIAKLIKEGYVLCNDKNTKASYQVKKSDKIRVIFPKPQVTYLEPIAIPLEFLYEDQDIAVVNKPPFVSVHHGSGIKTPTLVNGLLYHCKNLSGIGGVLRPGIVHRLDKETSGVLVVAKNDIAHQNLTEQFAKRKVEKTYLALVHGVPKRMQGVIEHSIGRDKKNRTKISNNTNSPKSATTQWTVKKIFKEYSLLEAVPLTGRTHQIRVHFSLLGYPIVGDKIYTKKRKNISLRHFLHAESLSFLHPTTMKRVKFFANLPKDLDDVLKGLKSL
tara:strand:- start:10842 stop:11759 length:918 start_codon:yes stop_codon:yes gene_type:complete